MAISRAVIHHLQVQPGHAAGLPKRDTAWDGGKELAHLHGKDGKGAKKRMKAELEASCAEIDREQELLWANDRRSLLLVFQAMDAAGKDGTIKHVMSGVNPQGCRVTSFKQPSALELDHDFLWRINRALPERGQIGIFNRSHYEEVLVVRVHPEFLAAQHLPHVKGDIWKRRFREINDWERMLADNGFPMVKIFLHLSKEEQKRRLLDRIDTPEKNWKFSMADVHERDHWDDYQAAYDDMLRHTSTEEAPWYVVPADHKWFTRVIVAEVLVATLMDLDPQYPIVTKAQRAELTEAREALEAS